MMKTDAYLSAEFEWFGGRGSGLSVCR